MAPLCTWRRGSFGAGERRDIVFKGLAEKIKAETLSLLLRRPWEIDVYWPGSEVGKMRIGKRLFLVGLAAVAITAPVQARIRGIVIEHRDAPAYQGAAFGNAGAYEWIRGRAFGELDPKDPLNGIITDLQFAPRNAQGFVEYSVTFTLAKPVDPAKASGVLLYDVANRGRIALAGSSTNAGALADLFKSGHIVLSSGWEGDVPARDGTETIAVPVARNPDGSSITGRVLVRFSDMARNATTLPMARGEGAGFPAPLPASLDTTKATLTRRAAEGSAIVPIRAADWAFADCAKVPFPGEPDAGKVCLKGGFDPANLYELVYTAKDPQVLGIGFAATRDLNAFFRHAEHDDYGVANPVAGQIAVCGGAGHFAIGQFPAQLHPAGIQSGRSGRHRYGMASIRTSRCGCWR